MQYNTENDKLLLMSAKVFRNGIGSAGNRPPGKTLRSTGSSRLLLAVHHQRSDELSLSEAEVSSLTRKGSLASGEHCIRLTDEELREEITRNLTTHNPQAFKCSVEFSFKDRCYVPVQKQNHYLTLLSIESTCLHKDSKEAQDQIARTLYTSAPREITSKQATDDVIDDAVGDDDNEGEEGDAAEGTEETVGKTGEENNTTNASTGPVESTPVETQPTVQQQTQTTIEISNNPAIIVPMKKLTNQFNFCDRAALTYNLPSKELGTQTIPPPRTTFSVNVTQWEIYDAYQEDFEQQQKGKEIKVKDKTNGGLPRKDEGKRKSDIHLTDNASNRQFLSSKILERMINQNTYDEITQDFRYWEDPSDEFREEEGTLLPLWKIFYEKTKDFNVMSLCWNPHFQDLFAVAFGLFDFREQRQSEGMMCVFTLKTPSHPEYEVFTEAGVASVDIHPTMPNLTVLGLYDGNVEVYDLQASTIIPQYRSSSVLHKHTATIWQVRWGRDLQDNEQNFFTVAADGQVFCWTLLQHELAQMLVISLNLLISPLPSPEGENISLTGCGTALAFHPKEPMIFLVGTEEGRIYKCSTAYTSIFLSVTDAHYMPVHQIDYNKFDASIYASCSGDWRVKIWEDNRIEPLFEFDLASPVGDVAWAPYSSTVFAAATADGKVHVFDLNVNKYKAICVQTVVAKKKCRLTRLSFNPIHAVIIVGDNSGHITSLKLSPNLRKKQKPPKKGVVYEHETLEKIKLEKLLALVRDPQNPATVLDTESNS